MRTLLFRGLVYSNNGHTQFHQGRSENPQIGTVEDWYLINIDTIAVHPFHLHLVNFQIVKHYELKFFKTPTDHKCTYYEIDFYLKYANITQCFPKQLKKKIQDNVNSQGTYDEICDFVADNRTMTKTRLDLCFGKFKNEHDFENNISGIDVEQPLGNSAFKYNSSLKECNIPDSKYLCLNMTKQFPIFSRGWKDTGYVHSSRVLVLRIRWTKTDYNKERDGTNYFDVPEKHLIEFPGFVYHCHFMNHEDKVMMRPFMMQPSEAYKKKGLPVWKDTYKKINEQMGCGVGHNKEDDLTRN